MTSVNIPSTRYRIDEPRDCRSHNELLSREIREIAIWLEAEPDEMVHKHHKL